MLAVFFFFLPPTVAHISSTSRLRRPDISPAVCSPNYYGFSPGLAGKFNHITFKNIACFFFQTTSSSTLKLQIKVDTQQAYVCVKRHSLPLGVSWEAMTNPNPSPGLLRSSTSSVLIPRPSLAADPSAPPMPLDGGPPALPSTPSRSRGSRVSVTGTESRKLVL